MQQFMAFSALNNAGLGGWKESIVGFGSDGASVMVGRRGGVVALLKAEVPHLVDIHCLAHRLELGALDAIKENEDMKKVSDMLSGTLH